jgi:branched-chain amino acid transport system substrate-binding protein
MGANHPYPNAPKAAGEAIATELGFEVLPPLAYAMAPPILPENIDVFRDVA